MQSTPQEKVFCLLFKMVFNTLAQCCAIQDDLPREIKPLEVPLHEQIGVKNVRFPLKLGNICLWIRGLSVIYFCPPPPLPLCMPAYDSETWFAFCGFNCILGQLPE